MCGQLLQISMFLLKLSLSVLLLLRVSSSDLGCFKVNSCKCIMKDGSGVIDLKAMGDAQGFLGRLRPLQAEQLSEDGELYLSFSPCLRFSEPDDLQETECTDVAACVLVRYQTHERLGMCISHWLSFKRIPTSEYETQHTKRLHKHTKQHDYTKKQSLSPQQPLHIWVESPCACPNACPMGDLGVGTIFLIILCLSAAAYFILGEASGCSSDSCFNSSRVALIYQRAGLSIAECSQKRRRRITKR
uniref:Uncharacterized protein n=1 Tax=Gouania willdenowi TaxID=441366 RepID=A0A8C5D923_GOUWI